MVSTNQLGQTCNYVIPNIIVSDTPRINAQVSPTSFCAPQTVTLNMTGTPGCGNFTQTQIQWGCGNITTCPGFCPSATHLYGTGCNAQCYNVNVVLTNSCGCIGTHRLTNAVCVLPKPVVNFTVDVSSGVCVNSLTSNFTAASNGPGFTYSWYVNGALIQSNSSVNFTHTFPAAFNCYQVKLIVANSSGCVDSLVRDNFICVFTAPHLSFTVDTNALCVDSGQAGLLCLKNTSQPFLSNPVWRIRGGSPLVNLGPFVGDTCVQLNRIGTYQVTLIGSYGPNCVDSIVVPNVFELKKNPTPCFTASDSFTCNTSLNVTFTNCSTAPPGSSYVWNFGAGALPTTSNLQNPGPVIYNGLGKRDVSLAITSTNGCFKSLKKLNYISVDTVAPFMLVNPRFGCPPIYSGIQSVTNVPSGSPYYICNFEWWIYLHGTTTLVNHHFGSAFGYTFNQPGVYDIKLEVTTCSNGVGAGCKSSTWDTAVVRIGTPPTCSLSVSPDTVCFEADSTTFSLTGPGCDFDRIMVHFGDEPNPNDYTFVTISPFSHIYQSFGDFDAWVIPVKDSCQSDSVLRAHVTVLPPAASFTTSTNCLSGDTVCFTSSVISANRYNWSFSCVPDTFANMNPCILLPHCDSCDVTLTAYNDTTHCVHQKRMRVETACAGVNATFSPDTLLGCRGFPTTTFTNTTPGAVAGQTVWHWGITGVPNQVGLTGQKNFYPGVFYPYMVYTAPGGCVDTAFGIVLGCNMHVDFGPLRLCLPDSFHFQTFAFDTPVLASITPGPGCDSIVSWFWDFGGGDTTSEPNPVRYFNLGSRLVKVRVTNMYGCVDSISHVVTAGTPVYSYWDVDTNICPGSTICITNNTSSAVALTETWQFPGSNFPTFSGHTPPCLTYANTGDYMLVYTISGGTCYKSDTLGVHVHSPELSGYLTDNFATCPPLPVCAVNTSQWVDSLTDVYTWNFGNGEYVEVNPCDFYGFPGVFPVMLTVVTNNGCRDTVMIDTVVVDGPYGSISHSVVGACSCQDSVDFVVSSIKATELTFVYGCNQGFKIENPIFPIGTDANPHIYTYKIPYCIADSCLPQVTFGDASGCHVLYNDSVLYVDSPTINIAFNNYGICLTGTVCFFDSTAYTLPPNISYSTDWYWTFGDPFDTATSTLQNPCHLYSQPGAYPVTLRVHSNFGCYDSVVSMDVVIIPKFPIAGFYADDSLICAETATCFHDTSYVDSITGPQFWYWDFGDGTTDSVSGPNPCHTYMTGGYYTVQLCLVDSVGCSDCVIGSAVRVISKPIADAGPDTVLCYGVVVQLNGSGADTCRWSPPNLVSNSNICNPTTIVLQDTNFVLTVIDTFGCFGVDTLNVLAGRVFADFTLPVTSCQEDSVCVTDASTVVNGIIVDWQYDFENFGSVSGQNVCYLYSAPGSYNILQTVTDNHGCVDTAQKPITIFPQPMAAFSLNDTVICSDQTICISDLSTSVTSIQSWSWSFGPNQSPATGPNPPCHLFTPPYQPSYPVTLVVTDLNSCVDTATIVVTVNEIPQANFSWVTSCEDTTMPLANTSLPGDGAIDSCYWFLWIGAPTPVIDNNCNTAFHFPPGFHDVQLAVHDLNGCVDTIVKTVQTDSISQLIIYPGDTTLCLGNSVDYYVSGVFDNIVWSPNVWLSDPYSPIVTVTPLGNIGYIISASNGVCEAAHDTFTVTVIQPIPIDVMATPEQIVLGLSSSITSQIAAPIDSIIWAPDTTLDCRSCPNPVATPTYTTTYCATIYYSKNLITCFDTACVTITVLNSCGDLPPYIPNTFTPNGDGLNDVFMIRGIAATKIHYFRVFDRWGKLVYETTGGATNQTRWGWDGTDRSGEKLNPAVFVYTYEIECINGDVLTGNGNVTLVR